MNSAGNIQEWIDGFEKELNRRFKANLKLVSIDRGNLRSIQAITSICCIVSGVTEASLKSLSRKQPEVNVRQICMYLARKYLTVSEVFVGNYFNRDHTTVIHAVRTIKDRLFTNDERTVPLLNECEKKVKEFFENENHK